MYCVLNHTVYRNRDGERKTTLQSHRHSDRHHIFLWVPRALDPRVHRQLWWSLSFFFYIFKTSFWKDNKIRSWVGTTRTEGTDPGTFIDTCNGRTWGGQGRSHIFFYWSATPSWRRTKTWSPWGWGEEEEQEEEGSLHQDHVDVDDLMFQFN